jgi:hypothetical protein
MLTKAARKQRFTCPFQSGLRGARRKMNWSGFKVLGLIGLASPSLHGPIYRHRCGGLRYEIFPGPATAMPTSPVLGSKSDGIDVLLAGYQLLFLFMANCHRYLD